MPQIMVKGWECCRCEHTWSARKDSANHYISPLRCPACGSCYWDRPRKKEEDTNAKE